MPHHARHSDIVPSTNADSSELVRQQLCALQAAFRSHVPLAAPGCRGPEEFLLSRVPQFEAGDGDHPRIAYIKEYCGRYLFANDRWESLCGTEWFGKTDRELWPQAAAAGFRNMDAKVLNDACVCQAIVTVPTTGGVRQWLTTEFPIEMDTSPDRLIGGVAVDITLETFACAVPADTATAVPYEIASISDRPPRLVDSRHELADIERNQILEAIANDESVHDIFGQIIACAQDHLTGATCAISVVDCRKLRLAADGGLPADFVTAVEYVDVGSNYGNPALVAQLGEPFVVGDIGVHPSCAEVRHVALQNGIRSCTSVPLIASDGSVAGTFDVYRGEPHAPDECEFDLIESAARLAGIAIEHHRRTSRTSSTADPLTNLPNRAAFETDLERALAAPDPGHVAVLWIDLDRLTAINENLGHRAGDELLKMVAARLLHASPETARLCRAGGDEFAALLTGISSPAEAIAVGRRYLNALREPFQVDHRDIMATCSIGIAVYPEDGESAATLLRNADAAMYRAKAWGKNTAERYKPAINDVRQRLELENDLRGACSRSELKLFYQPQVDMHGHVDGFEALLRWQHPKLGLLSPARFLPIAEETGLIIDPIGEWVLRQACIQYVNWRPRPNTGLKMAVNISAAQVYRTDLPKVVASILEQTGMPPESMEVELTESVLMQNLEESARKVNALRALGVTVAIDDFGTGYSSLSYLRQLPVDTLKLDKSFLDGIGSHSGHALIRAVATLAKDLGLRLIAEGVETDEQMAALRDIGINHIQGFLISRPVPAAEARVLLN